MNERRRSTEEIITFALCALCMMGLLLFSIVRGLRGEFLISFVDATGLAGTSAAFWHVYRTHSIRLAGPFLAILSLAGSLLVLAIGGPAERYLLYPTVVVAFFLTSPAMAITITGISVVVASLLLLPGLPVFAFAKFLLSVSGCMLFAYIFARERNLQRDELLRLSTVDGLTGVGNRRAFDFRLSELIRIQQRTPDARSMMLVDLDNFKTINDTMGHAAGDEVLKLVADAVIARIRAGDDVFRYGGDEFVILVSTDIKAAIVLAEELRSLVEQLARDRKFPVTLSMGVAQHQPDESAEAWLARTDAALFEAKRAGRNRVHTDNIPQVTS